MAEKTKKLQALVRELTELEPLPTKLQGSRISFLKKRIESEKEKLKKSGLSDSEIDKVIDLGKASGVKYANLNKEIAKALEESAMPIGREVIYNPTSRVMPEFDEKTIALIKEGVKISREIGAIRHIDVPPGQPPRFKRDEDLDISEKLVLSVLLSRYGGIRQELGEAWVWVRKQSILDSYNNQSRKIGKFNQCIPDIVVV